MQRFQHNDRIDIDIIAQCLQRTFGQHAPMGRGLGRERLKTVIVLLQGCSPAVADQAIDALVFRGQLAFHEDGKGPGTWRFGRAPARC